MSAEVATVQPGAHGLIFLPYMAGERTPLWSIPMRAACSLACRIRPPAADMLRAIMEGCAFAVYHNLKIAEARRAWSANGWAEAARRAAQPGARSRRT